MQTPSEKNITSEKPEPNWPEANIVGNKSIMPVIFVGHGSPMNAIETNQFSRTWDNLGSKLPKPAAILAISAHWYVDGTLVQSAAAPKQIYDMYGFPKPLYDLQYPVQGSIKLSMRVKELLGEQVSVNDEWGIDHGTWSVLSHMYPKADVPVVQLSIDGSKSPKEHYDLAARLKPLREEGILIFASGNIVHNLRKADWNNPEGSFETEQFDNWAFEQIQTRKKMQLVHFEKGPMASYAVPTLDHYIPVLYAAAIADEQDEVVCFNRGGHLGSISMTSYCFFSKRS